MALAGAVAIAASTCIERLWLALLEGFGINVDHRDAAAVFYVSQLGKYVPGSVWPVLAQVRLGARWGAPRRAMLATGLLLITMVTATGISVGALLLPWSSPDGLRRYWWLTVLLPLLLVLMHPRVLMHLIDRLSLWSGEKPLEARLSGRGVLRAGLWAMLAWVLLGIHLTILMTAYGPVGALDVAAAVGAIGLAWAAGVAFIPAPAGAGVREGVLLVTLGPLVGAEAAIATALASRALLILADITLAATSVGQRSLRDLSAAVRARRSDRGRATSGSIPRARSRRGRNA